MNTQKNKRFHALLVREWIVMQNWVFSLVLMVLAGPFINWLNAVGEPRSTRLASVFQSIYTAAQTGIGTMDVSNHHIVDIDFHRVPVFIVGAPPVRLWVIGQAIALGALMATADRQMAVMTDLLSGPVSKREAVQAKFLFGTIVLLATTILRTVVVWCSNAVSPLHFAPSTWLFSGVVDFFVALATFAVAFVIGSLVGNIFLAWAIGFLALVFPLALSPAIRFLGVSPGLQQVAAALEHQVLLKLSPFWYTDYNTRMVQHFAGTGRIIASLGRMKDITIYTAMDHPWVVISGSVIVCILGYLSSLRVFTRTPTEDLQNLFVSPRAVHLCLSVVSVIFGSIAAQIVSYLDLLVFLVMGSVCYGILWFIYRQIENRQTFRGNKKQVRAV